MLDKFTRQQKCKARRENNPKVYEVLDNFSPTGLGGAFRAHHVVMRKAYWFSFFLTLNRPSLIGTMSSLPDCLLNNLDNVWL